MFWSSSKFKCFSERRFYDVLFCWFVTFNTIWPYSNKSGTTCSHKTTSNLQHSVIFSDKRTDTTLVLKPVEPVGRLVRLLITNNTINWAGKCHLSVINCGNIFSKLWKRLHAEYIWISLIANNSNILKCSIDDYLETTGGPLLF